MWRERKEKRERERERERESKREGVYRLTDKLTNKAHTCYDSSSGGSSTCSVCTTFRSHTPFKIMNPLPPLDIYAHADTM